MREAVPQEVLARVRKLALLPAEVRQSRWAVSVTKLTVLKSLCQDHGVADRFVTHLARRVRQKVEQKADRPGHLATEEWARQREMIGGGVDALEGHLEQPSEEGRSRLWTLLQEMAGEQNEYRNIHGGPVRIIRNNDLLLVEYALHTVLADQASLPVWAYQTARHYAERYNSGEGTGLISSSTPLLQDVADFWMQEFGLDLATLTAPATQKKAKKGPVPTEPKKKRVASKKARFTPRQGQFLAFIHLYRKLHRQGPAEHEMVTFFRATPPAVHGMIVKLEELGLITRERGVPRAARVTVPEAEIPPLEDVEGPPW
jgi:hypothetical protein